ncbi:hypothetical protein KR044_008675 [Drosophila immigrans]|nr:hypothetical protein KR044_008675 [Drosophila immigrans]
MPVIKLQTSDNHIFETELDVIMCSGTIKVRIVLNKLCCSGEDEVVPLPKVSSEILIKILEWAEFHRKEFADATTEDDEEVTEEISPWDCEFINVDQSTLVELITVANFLNIQGLLQLACKTMANMIRGKTTDEIRTIFNIKNDLTLSEETLMRKESN